MNDSKLDWGDVRIFLAVARCGTLGAAARQLGQTQPTMGRRLRALEEAVGHTLFQRTAEGFVLTDEGHAVLMYAERMEEEAHAFMRSLAGNEQQLTGGLRVSSSDWYGIHVLTPVFAGFLARHPPTPRIQRPILDRPVQPGEVVIARLVGGSVANPHPARQRPKNTGRLHPENFSGREHCLTSVK